ncbi:MAG: helix-turn-helix domain-containing protein [Oceanibaculum nanhaiense]|jgi:AcrR family transcriptional regulator|uniref:TetR/AcrR family transcriptional regulator n=1 Tax=Oceanibaculum nanhaiense TaxID=1909734 RepID=UPI0032EBD682
MRPRHEICETSALTKMEQVADAARRLFARYGYKRTSMDDIAREAGVAKATLYLHFKGKDDVFRTMMRRTADLVLERCDAALASGAPFAERLEGMLGAYYGTWIDLFGDPAHWGELVLVKTQIAMDQAKELEGLYIDRFRGFLAKAEAEGEIDLSRAGTDADQLCQTLMQAALGAKSGTPPTQEEFRQRLRNIARLGAAALTRHAE